MRARAAQATSSDACESGAGITAAAGLTTCGVEDALRLPTYLPTTPEIVLLSLFAGIEGARRALDLLGIKPLRHLSIEIDRNAIRTVNSVYPDAILLEDIKELDEAVLDRHLSGIDPVFILVIGGSPCQDVSGLNAQRVGIGGERSSLFFEMVRVIKLLLKEKWKVFSMTENVASMSNADRDIFSQTLGLIPRRACPSGFCQVRRPRYYWINWVVRSSPGVQVEAKDECRHVKLAGKGFPSHLWVSDGWEFCGNEATKLPTFVRAIRRKKQTHLPAGIATTPKPARQRWRRDNWRYPPYHYRTEFCLKRRTQRPGAAMESLRPPRSTGARDLDGVWAWLYSILCEPDRH